MSGNRKLRQKDVFFNREKMLNRMINRFARLTFTNNLNDLAVYDSMNTLRLDIKRNLDIQSQELHSQSRRRRYVFYEQLSKFKSVYCHWKNVSFPAFITRLFKLPEHLIHSLQWFYEG